MISYSEALELLEAQATCAASEVISSLTALGRVCATEVFSPIALPSFDNSAMDGFALHSAATQTASAAQPVRFKVGEIIQASASVIKTALADECVEIMTGAAVPLGYDAVVPVEQVTRVNLAGVEYIELRAPVAVATNLRFSGEDVQSGQLLFNLGHQLQANDIMLLASVGIGSLPVFARLGLAIAASGEELSEDYPAYGASQAGLKPGQIYNSNGPLLMNLAADTCFAPRYAGIVRDNSAALQDFIATSRENILITTGAVSMGKWDFIPATLRELGAEIIFHGVAIRPGKPVLFARLSDGRYFFGLPGNPVSAMVGWRFFVIPLIRRLLAKERESAFQLPIAQAWHKKHQLSQFLKAKLVFQDGSVRVEISGAQESFKIQALTTNDLWAIVPEARHELAAGELIEVVPMYAELS